LPSPLGEVVAVASEHDATAGTERGPNTIFVFELGGLRVCHFGDFGQRALREEQREAIGPVDLLFLPVGGGPTMGAELAARVARELEPSWVVPMHYRTERIGFLDPVDGFLERMGPVVRPGAPEFDTAALEPGAEPLTVVPEAP
ncbi:MAG TPA: MBL fold metallo-hydrolase, partial [Gemmatimonadota bacterium]|nr:MBL fold metallo-hydrolase [Gemmatimonadota bacterium]